MNCKAENRIGSRIAQLLSTKVRCDWGGADIPEHAIVMQQERLAVAIGTALPRG